MKTYKEFINKAKPVELDEIAFTGTAIATAVKTAPVWLPLLKKAVLGTAVVGGAGAAAKYDYDQKMKGKKGIFPDFTKMFNRGETIDDLNKLNDFWKDNTKTNNDTKIDGIGNDLVGQTFKPTSDTKTDTEVGTGTQTQTQTQTINPAIVRARTANPAIARAETNVKTRAGKPFNFGKLPKLPGTAHNVGKRVNPQ
mgnify:FL=1